MNTAGWLLVAKLCLKLMLESVVLHIAVQAGEEGRCGDGMIRSFKVSHSYISQAKVA